MIDVEKLFLDLKKAVKKAGFFLLSQTIEVENHKNVNDLLTKNDKDTEEYLLKFLKAKYPDVNIISEEFNPDVTLKGVSVVIDPIDGTCNYAAGLDLFGIQVAIFNEDEVVGSIIYLPKKKEMFTAFKNKGCYLNNKRIEVNKEKLASDGILILSDFYKDQVVKFEKQYELVKDLHDLYLKTRLLGAACIDFTSLVKGNALTYICNYSNIWDIAPGLFLAKEAGCVYTSLVNEKYSFGEPALVVSNNLDNLNLVLDTYRRGK